MPNVEAMQGELRAMQRAREREEEQGFRAPRPVLSEGVFKERCADYDAEPGVSPEDPRLRASRERRGAVAKIASKLQGNILQTRRNPTMNGAEKEIIAADAGKQALEEQSTVLDADIAAMEKWASDMENEVRGLLQPPDPVTKDLAPEIRAYLRGLSDAQRDDLLSKKQSDDYPTLMYAVASAPAWMSGVAEGQKMGIKDTIIALRRPQLLSLPRQCAKEIALLKKCREGFADCINDMVDFDTATALKELAGGGQ